jgi:hypothetical protein
MATYAVELAVDKSVEFKSSAAMSDLATQETSKNSISNMDRRTVNVAVPMH